MGARESNWVVLLGRYLFRIFISYLSRIFISDIYLGYLSRIFISDIYLGYLSRIFISDIYLGYLSRIFKNISDIYLRYYLGYLSLRYLSLSQGTKARSFTEE